MDTRLKSRLWVDAHIRTCFLADMPAFVIGKGDDDRGGVLLKVNRFGNGGVQLYELSLDFDGNRVWRRLGPEDGLEEREADGRIGKKRQYDSDLWVIEIEDARAQYQPDAPISAL